MRKNREHFDRGILISLVLHIILALVVMLSPAIFPAFGKASWGSETSADHGISVEIISSISGVPLPSPIVVNDNAAANESAGFYQTEPTVEPISEEAFTGTELIPEAPTTVRAEAEPSPAKVSPPSASTPVEPEADPAMDNTIPFGQGGRPSINYGRAGGEGTGVGTIGEGSFGVLYEGYVDSITRRISENWLHSTVDVNLRRAPRIFMTFDILRDGSIVNVEISQTSGNRSLDRSAQRAIFASNPLTPLPTGFRGRSVSVSFWFEYTKQWD